MSTFVFDTCKIIAYSVSVLLTGVYPAFVRYEKNKNIFKTMNPVSLDFSKIPQVHRCVISKNSFMKVWWRNVLMFTVLPSSRAILMYNPFLFLSQLSVTNQFTVEL